MEMNVKLSYCKFGYDARANIRIFKVQQSACTDHKPFNFWFLNSKKSPNMLFIPDIKNFTKL